MTYLPWCGGAGAANSTLSWFGHLVLMSGCLLGMAVTYIYPGLGEVVGGGAKTLWYDHLDILVLVSDCDLYLPWWGLGGGWLVLPRHGFDHWWRQLAHSCSDISTIFNIIHNIAQYSIKLHNI